LLARGRRRCTVLGPVVADNKGNLNKKAAGGLSYAKTLSTDALSLREGRGPARKGSDFIDANNPN